MGSVDDFEEFFKNYAQKYSSPKLTTTGSVVPVVRTIKKTGANLNAPKLIKATVASITPTVSLTASPTAAGTSPGMSTRSKSRPVIPQSNQITRRVTRKAAVTQSVKRLNNLVKTAQGQKKKTKLDVGLSYSVSTTPSKSSIKSIQNTISLPSLPQKSVKGSRFKPTTVSQSYKRSAPSSKNATVSASKPATVSASKPATVSAPKPTTVPASKPATVPASKHATVSVSKPAAVPASKPATVPQSKHASVSQSNSTTIPSTPMLQYVPILTPALLQNTVSQALLQQIQSSYLLNYSSSTSGLSTASYTNYLSFALASSNSSLKLNLFPTSPQIIPPLRTTTTLAPIYHHVTQKAYKDLQLISPPQFTDAFLQSGFFKADKVEAHQPEYSNILEYIFNSQAHANSRMELLTVFKITRPSTSSSLTPTSTVNSATALQNLELSSANRFKMMLWHGTKPRSVAPILKDGFKCPLTGNQMFGKGVYFADRISKSAQYCNQDVYCAVPKQGEIGYLFLCQVTLGKCYNAKNIQKANMSAPTATRHDGSVILFDSLKCTGENVPDREKQREIDGVIWPLGPTIKNTRFPTYTLLYNEFIVYNPEMVKIKYLVKVQFK